MTNTKRHADRDIAKYGKFLKTSEDVAWYSGRAAAEGLIPEGARLDVSSYLADRVLSLPQITEVEEAPVPTPAGKHDECYRLGLHPATKAGRTSCRRKK